MYKHTHTQRERETTGDIAAPDGAVVAAVGAETLAVVGEPDGWGVVLCAREEQIAVSIVLQERQWPLVPFHQYRPHFDYQFLSLSLSLSLSVRL